MLHTLVLNILRQQGATNYSVLHKKGLVPFLHLHVKLCVVFFSGDSWGLLCKNNGYKNYYCYWSTSKNKNRAYSQIVGYFGDVGHIQYWHPFPSDLPVKAIYLRKLTPICHASIQKATIICHENGVNSNVPTEQSPDGVSGNTCFTFL